MRKTGDVAVAAAKNGRAINATNVLKGIENAPARTRLVRFGDTRAAKPSRVE